MDYKEIIDAGLDMHEWNDAENSIQCPTTYKKGPPHSHGLICKKCGTERSPEENEDFPHFFLYAVSGEAPQSLVMPPCGDKIPQQDKGLIQTVRVCLWCYRIVEGESCEYNSKECRQMGIAELRFCRKR